MAGNSRRRGAVRRSDKKGATTGSGGNRRRSLEGKGPTPKAQDRPAHKAYRSKSSGGATRRPMKSTAAPASDVVAGRNSVIEALRAQIPATAVYVAPRLERDERITEALAIASDRGIPVLECSRPELDRLTDDAVHQGLALKVAPYEYADPSDLVDPQDPRLPLLVALDGITDPRNLGAILRSVAAFGGQGVIVPARRSAGMTPTAWKTSAGAAARIPVAQVTNLTRTLGDFAAQGYFVLGLDMDGDVQLPQLQLTDVPLVVVVGSEGKGLSRLVREACDQVVSIPMAAAVESLNAGIATGVTLYEIARQRADVTP